jgi:hypothetical protein
MQLPRTFAAALEVAVPALPEERPVQHNVQLAVATVPVAAQAPTEQPVRLAAIQRRLPRILIDYRGAVFHM